MIDLDREQLLETFLAESEEQLAEMESVLVAVEAHPEDADALQTIFRAAHTLKGNAASMGFDSVAEVAHALEGLLERVRSHQLTADEAIVSVMLRAVDVARALIAKGETPAPSDTALHQQLLEDLKVAAGGGRTASAILESVGEPCAPASGHTLRVEIGRLDRMLDLSGEIAVARGRLTQMLKSHDATGAMLEAHREMDRIFMDLQEEILRSRMVPVGPTFRQQLRTLRDATQTAGKLARLEILGEDVEVDTTIVEQLRGPLTHMVRNAVDHGIEEPELRVARGKDPRGRIRLEARHEAGGIVIELSDDGAGLDRARIAAAAVARGLTTNPEALADSDLLRLIFEPGLSTAENVTELSGRGVGMDVVRRQVETLRGSIAVDSRAGEGTRLTIRVPLTVAIIQGFLVAAGDETYVLPLEAIVECVDLGAGGETAARAGVVSLHDMAVPYLRLREAFGLARPEHARESLVVVSHEGRHAALAVDALLGESQVVIKPFSHALKGLSGIVGSTILGSGRVALILDVPALMQSAKQAAGTF